MSRNSNAIRPSAVLAGLAMAWACADNGPTTPPPEPDTPRPTTLAVSPPRLMLDSLEPFGRLDAEVFDQNGRLMTGVSVAWSSSDTSVATVAASGVVTAVDNGMATITATAGNLTATATIIVVLDRAALVALYDATDGPKWTNGDNWRTNTPLREWHGVATNSRGQVVGLDLANNGLRGRLPANLGNLPALTTLRIGGNALSGRLPLSLAYLDLVEFNYSGTGLCVPADGSFQAWLNGIDSHDGTGAECVHMSDRAVLEALYHDMDGPRWENSDNWLTDAPLREWYGVDTDASGRVIRLDLRINALSGPIPPEIGDLVQLTELDLLGNDLSGPIPPEIGNLTSLTNLTLRANALSGPIPPEIGNLVQLTYLDLPGNKLSGVIPAEIGGLANLESFFLHANNLTGPIPPEIGNLASVQHLYLYDNHVSGVIPVEIGNLASLTHLLLMNNDLSGPIPAEIGNLANLRVLDLGINHLSGAIPSEIGRLASLIHLRLVGNDLSGPIPPEIGGLASLFALHLEDNGLTGPVPPEFGGLSSLVRLALANNSGLSGPLPASLTGLHRLETLIAGGTGLCAPADPGFQVWLDGVVRRRVARCASGEPTAAYLTQAVQSREYPVPLVAGDKALLRVFVTAAQSTAAVIPPVRARFYLNGTERHSVDIPAGAAPIPTEIVESDLSGSANAEIPGEVVEPGLEMVIEIDPDGTLDSGLGVRKRIPATGRVALDVREMPALDLTVIPFLWSADPNRDIVEAVEGMAADPDGHELLWATRALLPVGDLQVTAHEPVLSSSNNVFTLLHETGAIQAIEGGGGHYMGMMSTPVTGASGAAPGGPSRTSFSTPDPEVIAHELGHNLGLAHAPCRATFFVDPLFPDPDGSTGAWGYDFRDGGRLVHPNTHDLMAYCRPKWISDYHFTNALRFRLVDVRPRFLASLTTQNMPSLLLWGGTDAEGAPSLNPAFVVDAPAALPNAAGGHRITGRTANGDELFTLDFAMPEVADGDGSSSFAFVLPVEPGWAGSLASITLAGPGGSVTLDGGTDVPMTILLDPGTGEVRGILRDLPEADAAALAPQPGPGSVAVLFSRGIPDAAAWSR